MQEFPGVWSPPGNSIAGSWVMLHSVWSGCVMVNFLCPRAGHTSVQEPAVRGSGRARLKAAGENPSCPSHAWRCCGSSESSACGCLPPRSPRCLLASSPHRPVSLLCQGHSHSGFGPPYPHDLVLTNHVCHNPISQESLIWRSGG